MGQFRGRESAGQLCPLRHRPRDACDRLRGSRQRPCARFVLTVLGKFLETAGLEVNLISDTAEFDAWLASVDRVTRFRVTLRPPNPRWSKRAKEVRELATEIEAERLTIDAQSEAGLQVRDTLLDGAADTAAMGNGSYKVTGFSGRLGGTSIQRSGRAPA